MRHHERLRQEAEVRQRALDAELTVAMTRVAHSVLAPGTHPYDAASDAMGTMGGDLLIGAKHGGRAYYLWAEISDLFDDPRGPQSEQLCDTHAEAAARDWLTVDSDSVDSVDQFFDRWSPGTGTAWLALDD